MNTVIVGLCVNKDVLTVISNIDFSDVLMGPSLRWNSCHKQSYWVSHVFLNLNNFLESEI